MVWNHSGKTCSSLVSFRLLPGSLVYFMYLKDYSILEEQADSYRLLTWRKGRSDGCFVGSFLTSRSRISCFTQAAHILTGSGAGFLLRPQIFQPCLCLKFPAVYFKIGSTYCEAHDGPEWGTVLPVSIWSSDLVVSSEKWVSGRQEGLSQVAGKMGPILSLELFWPSSHWGRTEQDLHRFLILSVWDKGWDN